MTSESMYETGSKEWIALQNEKVKAAAEANKEIADLTQQQLQAGIGGALAEIRKKGMDTAGAIKDIFTQTLNNLNDQLVNLMTGKRTDFKGVAAGLFTSIAKTGLQTAEGKLLGGLGGVKPDGSKDRPFHVINAGADGKAGGGILGSVISTFVPHASWRPCNAGHCVSGGRARTRAVLPGRLGNHGHQRCDAWRVRRHDHPRSHLRRCTRQFRSSRRQCCGAPCHALPMRQH